MKPYLIKAIQSFTSKHSVSLALHCRKSISDYLYDQCFFKNEEEASQFLEKNNLSILDCIYEAQQYKSEAEAEIPIYTTIKHAMEDFMEIMVMKFLDETDYSFVLTDFQNGNPDINRESFMKYFRSDECSESLTVEDREEIFRQILLGSIDFTKDLLMDTMLDYDVTHLSVADHDKMELVISGIDFDQLRYQKKSLNQIHSTLDGGSDMEQHILGIIHLIDYLQDTAADQLGLKEEDVYLLDVEEVKPKGKKYVFTYNYDGDEKTHTLHNEFGMGYAIEQFCDDLELGTVHIENIEVE